MPKCDFCGKEINPPDYNPRDNIYCCSKKCLDKYLKKEEEETPWWHKDPEREKN